MSYRILFHPSAHKELSRLPNDVYARVRKKILALSDNPRPDNSRKLVGSRDWRVRVGTWRVVYRIDDDAREVTVTVVAHRREVYR